LGDAPYSEWHEWSTRSPGAFWASLWQYADIVAATGDAGRAWTSVVRGADRMAPPDPVLGPVWFDGARLNFAENLLRERSTRAALVYRGEDGQRREISFAELHTHASRAAAALSAAGVRRGDRVAGFMPNIPETVIAMLGAAWIGAVWSSCSPDFGTQGVVDRFGQIEPTVLVAADGYRYAGKSIDCLERVADIAAAMPSVKRVVIVPFLRAAPDLSAIANAVEWSAWLAPATGNAPPFCRTEFSAPLYIMYSSGTTGVPKCLVHSAGGTLLQHLKEHMLHGDLRAGEVIFYFTTCGLCSFKC
jgi:acetoacetyl-CoA synthetase